MDTPIFDFVRHYADGGALRLHMPGHKGTGPLGIERADITEIEGADSLYDAQGIIRASEENASALFGCPTFYSAEGSSLAIRAMLYLLSLYARENGRTALVWAARNCHRTFLFAAAMLDLDVDWLFPEEEGAYLSCRITPEEVERRLSSPEGGRKPDALYLTSPDYLGHVADLAGIAAVCHRHGVLLLVDNAHGAYLRFLPKSRHPIDLGADLCCDSAHKTLPVLTGGAYLHLSPGLPAVFATEARRALAIFGSTSPSYLILSSLDAANAALAEEFPPALAALAEEVSALRGRLAAHGFSVLGEEPMKLTLAPKSWGYTGTGLSALLARQGIVCEFADPDFLVLMFAPATGRAGLSTLERALLSVPRRSPIPAPPPLPGRASARIRIREALMRPRETVPVREAEGRILADACVSCPPAVPIAVSGEVLWKGALRCFDYYGIRECLVLKERFPLRP